MHRVVYVGEDSFWQARVIAACRATPAIAFEGSSALLDPALKLCRRARPDIVFVSWHLADGSGLDFQDRLAQGLPTARFIFLTGTLPEALLFQMVSRTIVGVILIHMATQADLTAALKKVCSGLPAIPPAAALALSRFRQRPEAFFKILSKAELALLPYILSGDADDEISRRIRKNSLTIRFHRQRILTKLGLDRTGKLMRWAFDRGFYAR